MWSTVGIKTQPITALLIYKTTLNNSEYESDFYFSLGMKNIEIFTDNRKDFIGTDCGDVA